MASYLQRYDATPAAERWPLVRGWMHEEPLAFYAELRKDRPILVMPELTLAAVRRLHRDPPPTRVVQRRAL
jgi:hypothetical protein